MNDVPLDDLPQEAAKALPYNHPALDAYAAQLEQAKGLPAGLLRAIKNQGEMSGAEAVSPKGARGVMQFMPDTAKRFNVADPTDPIQAMNGAADYLAAISKRLGTNDPVLLAAAYNAGENRPSLLAGRVPAIPETQAYVKRVAAALPKYQPQAVPADDLPDFTPPSAAQAPVAQPKPAGDQPGAVVSFLANAGKGFGKTMLGAQQLIGEGLKAAGADRVGGWLANDAVEGAKRLDAQAQPYADAHPVAAMAGDITGAVANPINRIVPMAGKMPLSALAGRAGAQGVITGLTTPATSSPDSFWTDKAIQAGVGGLTGAAAAPLASKAIDAAGNLISRGANAAATPIRNLVNNAGDTISMKAQQAVSKAAQEAGVDLSQIPAGIISSVQRDVQAAMNSGKSLDAAALLRKAQFDALGMKGTLGQLTRDPAQYTKEMNLRSVAGAGEPIMNLLNEQNQQLVGKLNQAGAATAPGTYGAGNVLLSELLNSDKAAKAAVDSAYGAARDSAGRYVPLDHVGFVKSANDALDEGMLGHYLPAQVRGLLNDVALGKLPLNVNTATQLDSVLSAAQRGAGDAERLAIGKVRSALNSAPAASQMGQDAMAAFAKARQLAAQRFGNIEATPALKAALDGAQPDKVFDRFILNGNAAEIGKTLSQMTPEGQGAVRNQVLSWIKDQALGGKPDEFANFSQSSFNRALNKLGDQRLAQLFGPNQAAELRTIGKVAGYIQSRPVGSAVNESNTAGAVMNLLSKIGNGALGFVPGGKYVAAAKDILADRAAKTAATKEAQQAVSGVVPPVATPPNLQPLKALLLPGVVAGGAGAGASVFQ